MIWTVIKDRRLPESYFHAVRAVIQQVHHSPVIWHCGTGATGLMKHRCRNMRHQDSSTLPGPKPPFSLYQMQIFQHQTAVAQSNGNTSE